MNKGRRGNKMEENGYELDVQIDPNALDVEWLQQPSLYHKYSKMTASARMLMEQADQKQDLVKAEVDLLIRSNPQKYTGEDKKPTEAQISALVLTNQQFKEAQEAYNEARHNFNVCLGALTAIDHKKSALENLVKLNGQSYFASPSVPRDIGKEWEESQRTKQSAQKMSAAIKNSDEKRTTRKRV